MDKPLDKMTYDELDEYIEKTQRGNWVRILLMASRQINYTSDSGTSSGCSTWNQ